MYQPVGLGKLLQELPGTEQMLIIMFVDQSKLKANESLKEGPLSYKSERYGGVRG